MRFIFKHTLQGYWNTPYIRVKGRRKQIEITAQAQGFLDWIRGLGYRCANGYSFEVSTHKLKDSHVLRFVGERYGFHRYAYSATGIVYLCERDMSKLFGPKPPRALYVRLVP